MNALKSLWKQLVETIIDVVTSKKAIATAIGAIMAHVIADPAKRAEAVASIVAYVLATGLVDHAKEIAKKDLGLATTTVTASTSTPVAPVAEVKS